MTLFIFALLFVFVLLPSAAVGAFIGGILTTPKQNMRDNSRKVAK